MKELVVEALVDNLNTVIAFIEEQISLCEKEINNEKED